MTALRAAGIRPGFRFIWDFGTIHGLTKAEREAAGREITAVANSRRDDADPSLGAWIGAARCHAEQAVPISKQHFQIGS